MDGVKGRPHAVHHSLASSTQHLAWENTHTQRRNTQKEEQERTTKNARDFENIEQGANPRGVSR